MLFSLVRLLYCTVLYCTVLYLPQFISGFLAWNLPRISFWYKVYAQIFFLGSRGSLLDIFGMADVGKGMILLFWVDLECLLPVKWKLYGEYYDVNSKGLQIKSIKVRCAIFAELSISVAWCMLHGLSAVWHMIIFTDRCCAYSENCS